MKKIGFIGAGHIASAIASGILASGHCSADDICVYDVDGQKCASYADAGFTVCKDEADVAANARYVFVCVRQKDLKSVLGKLAGNVTGANVIISVIAGVSISYFKKALGRECKVVRLMPNTPMLKGVGATAMSYEMPITYGELTEIRELLETTGIVEMLPEDRMNEVISVNSSSPVYFYMLLRAMINGAVAQGIDEETAKRLVFATAEGSVKLAETSDQSLDEMIAQVCTPNGTTVKAMEFLEKHGFEQAVSDAMLACTKRAYALEKETDAE